MKTAFDIARTPLALLFALIAAIACLLFALVPAPAWADEAHSDVAGATEMATVEELGSPDMVPISGMDVADGTYPIEVDSSSSFFKIVEAQLNVADGQMTAQITLRSSSYLFVYMGSGTEAAAAPESDYIPFDAETKSFTIPVDALDANLACAAFSKNRSKWYDRTIMFYANSLPEGALLVEPNDYGDGDDTAAGKTSSGDGVSEGEGEGAGDGTSESSARTATGAQPVALDLPDGEYSIEVNMTGGSGRASVSSPTWLVVKDGRAWARLLWSSSYYDYMIVDGTTYPNETDDGSNSTFTIPILKMDEVIPVVADTTAMGDPVEIDYQLTFYSNTVGEKSLIPQEAAIMVLEIALVIIVVGGILNHVLKRRRKR